MQQRLGDWFPKYRNPREHPICEGWGPTVHNNEFKRFHVAKKEVVLVSIGLSASLKKKPTPKHKRGVGGVVVWVNGWKTENGFYNPKVSFLTFFIG